MGKESSSSMKNLDMESYGAFPDKNSQIQKELEGKPYGVQKVMLMKKLGSKKDKTAVIVG
jgi:hypothetical protein